MQAAGPGTDRTHPAASDTPREMSAILREFFPQRRVAAAPIASRGPGKKGLATL